MILIDTRQKIGKHENIDGWLDAHGIPYEYRKLDFGDYMVDGSNVSVDTKQGLAEVAMDVGRDHDRFVREMERAREAGCRLVVLVECGAPYRSIESVARWTNDACRRCEWYRRLLCDPNAAGRCRKYHGKPIKGQTVARIMATLEERHGCRFEFVHPKGTARRICELLGVPHDA
jgi:hypothetical protein